MLIHTSKGQAFTYPSKEMGGGTVGYFADITYADGAQVSIEKHLRNYPADLVREYANLSESGRQRWTIEEYEEATIPDEEAFVLELMELLEFNENDADHVRRGIECVQETLRALFEKTITGDEDNIGTIKLGLQRIEDRRVLLSLWDA